MKIDLQNPEEFTLQNLRKLIASEDDSVHTQLRVTKNGYLFLSRDVSIDLDNILFGLEVFCAGNGYVGIDASEDDIWMNQLFSAIKNNWPKPMARYIDFF